MTITLQVQIEIPMDISTLPEDIQQDIEKTVAEHFYLDANQLKSKIP